jgi:hypothetical protein
VKGTESKWKEMEGKNMKWKWLREIER